MAIEAVAKVAQIGVGALQAGIGAIQQGKGNRRLNRLLQQAEIYQTPQEILDQNNMALNAAQTGYDAQTMAYLTNQSDRALSSSLGTATRLGADPNDIANIFDRNIQNIMKTAADSEQVKLQKFSTLMQTVGILADEKKAEFADRQALLKDKMASAAMQVQAGAQNVQSGLNAVTGGVANAAIGGLYPEQGAAKYKRSKLLTPTTAAAVGTPSLIGQNNYSNQITARPNFLTT